VEGADVRRPVTEESDGDARLVAQLEGEGGADRRGQPSADAFAPRLPRSTS